MPADFSSMLPAILPEIGLLLLAGLLLVLSLVLRPDRARGIMGWLAAGGVMVIALLSLIYSRPAAEEGRLIWGGMLRLDQAGFVFRLIFLSAAGVTALSALDDERLSGQGEFYALMLISTLGMSLMASAADLIMVYLAIETTTIPLMVLVGFLLKDGRSAESSVKYLLYAAMTSAVMLYGFSLIYGFTGTTQIYQIAGLLADGLAAPAAIAALVLVLVGFGFKISAAPFHFWAPDVYDGAPSPVAGFLSTASKAAGFIVLMRLIMVAFPAFTSTWSVILAVVATASMFVGNLLAMVQQNVKRLLAYSSIAQAGYILVGVTAGSALGTAGATYYLIAYMLTNLAAFGVVAIVGRLNGSDDLSSWRGLYRRSPALGLVILISVLSLGGVPPFAGFFAKVVVFTSAVEAGWTWLAVIGVINSVIGLYYYLTIVRLVFQSEEGAAAGGGIQLKPSLRVALGVCAAGVLLLGFIIAPALNWSLSAASL
jgi:NADH-quinone oxidoreductase subunit N